MTLISQGYNVWSISFGGATGGLVVHVYIPVVLFFFFAFFTLHFSQVCRGLWLTHVLSLPIRPLSLCLSVCLMHLCIMEHYNVMKSCN